MTVPANPPPPFSPDKSPDRITPAKPLETDVTSHPHAEGQPFSSYMEKNAPSSSSAAGAKAPTPLELSRPMGGSNPPTYHTLLTQAKTSRDTLGVVETHLQSPNLRLKRSQAHLLKSKLSDAHQHGKEAAAALGLELPPEGASDQPGTLGRFLAYVNGGQDQFAAIQKKLKDLSASGEQINPADMMLLQVKLGMAQQEIEYSATLLSKIVSSITQLMNIQL